MDDGTIVSHYLLFQIRNMQEAIKCKAQNLHNYVIIIIEYSPLNTI